MPIKAWNPQDDPQNAEMQLTNVSSSLGSYLVSTGIGSSKRLAMQNLRLKQPKQTLFYGSTEVQFQASSNLRSPYIFK